MAVIVPGDPVPAPSQLESLISKIAHALDDVRAGADAFIQSVSSDSGWIPFIGDAVRAMLEKFRDLVEELISKVISLLRESHAPFLMRANAQIWQNIGNQAGGSGQQVNRLSSQHEEWQGPAGRKHQVAVDAQLSAIEAYQGKTQSMESACNDVYNLGVVFYGTVLTTIAACVVTMGVGAVIACLVGLAAAAAELLAGNQMVAGSFNEIGEATPQFDGTPGAGRMGGWPQAVTA